MKMLFIRHSPAFHPPVRKKQWAASMLVSVMTIGAWNAPAHAVDEIQVYNGEIAKVGEWTVQQHLNYAINGRKMPDFSGGLIPHHALNGTPEFGYGITNWWEFGFYVPWAIDQQGHFHSNAVKVRTLFVTPDAENREFFYGVNFEFAYSTKVFSETRFNSEIRPIIGWRKGDYEFIFNPIVDISFGSKGEVTFAPAARFAKKVAENLQVGLEYYTDLGPLQHFLPLKEQEHNIYGVVDFKVGVWDVNFGVGYGLTPGSDRLMTKLIVGTDVNNLLPGKAPESGLSTARRIIAKP
jgi:hypothetical protein